MTINSIEVQSPEHLEELLVEMDESSKEGLRILYQQEQDAS
jgi:hypothetical protein